MNKEKALEKIKYYCDYQERSHFETGQKLFQMGISRALRDEILGELITSGILNEERFAIFFAGGKFRMKSWGKIKITQALLEKKVSRPNIQTALDSIPVTVYEDGLKRLAEKKWKSCRTKNTLLNKKKTYTYLLQKGFEHSLIQKVLKNIEVKNYKD
ncbi:MAG: RecX family transcriptional regulator [Bacteroidetes bacterium]|nr:RecX family transcriptional regulator [Bacteroidota bacterium]